MAGFVQPRNEKPVRIAVFREAEPNNSSSRGEFDIDRDALRSIFENDSVKDLPVAVISVAGTFRKGKSFLLNFFLHFLRAVERYQKDFDPFGFPSNWLKLENKQQCNKDESLEGFSWQRGDEPHTIGMWMWSRPYVVNRKQGGKIAVVLLDTQGSFDHNSTFDQCVKIFALSTMISSVQIFNVQGVFSKDHLQHLGLFTESARLALGPRSNASNNNPLQTLLILLRDFPDSSEELLGKQGGQRILNNILLQPNNQGQGHVNIRKNIMDTYEEILCYLFPHPGKKVTNELENSCVIGDIDNDFIREVRKLVTDLISSSTPGKCDRLGMPVLCKDISGHIERFAGECQKQPKKMELADVHAWVDCKLAVDAALLKYTEEMGDRLAAQPFTALISASVDSHKNYTIVHGGYVADPDSLGAIGSPERIDLIHAICAEIARTHYNHAIMQHPDAIRGGYSKELEETLHMWKGSYLLNDKHKRQLKELKELREELLTNIDSQEMEVKRTHKTSGLLHAGGNIVNITAVSAGVVVALTVPVIGGFIALGIGGVGLAAQLGTRGYSYWRKRKAAEKVKVDMETLEDKENEVIEIEALLVGDGRQAKIAEQERRWAEELSQLEGAVSVEDEEDQLDSCEEAEEDDHRGAGDIQPFDNIIQPCEDVIQADKDVIQQLEDEQRLGLGFNRATVKTAVAITAKSVLQTAATAVKPAVQFLTTDATLRIASSLSHLGPALAFVSIGLDVYDTVKIFRSNQAPMRAQFALLRQKVVQKKMIMMDKQKQIRPNFEKLVLQITDSMSQ